jgi:negative regulator of sigma E activity
MTSARDAQLSALLDGALGAEEAAALRAEIARDPLLAARLDQLARVDAALRALPARPVPADLRARLQAKLDAQVHDEARAREAHSPRAQPDAMRGKAPARLSRRRAWLAGLSAAAAASAAALLVLAGGPNPKREVSDAPSFARADAPATNPGAQAAGPELAPEAPRHSAATPSANDAPPAAAGGTPSPATLASGTASTGTDMERGPEAPIAPRHDYVGDLADDSNLAAAEAAVSEAAAPLPERSAEAARQEPTTLAADVAPEADASPALWIEATDAEASALELLEPADADVVAVLDWLNDLDALEAEAS